MAEFASTPNTPQSQPAHDRPRRQGGDEWRRGNHSSSQARGAAAQPRPNSRGTGRGSHGGRGSKRPGKGRGDGSAQSRGDKFNKELMDKMPSTTSEDGDAAENEFEDDENLCFICASNMIHVSVSTCSHRTCHLCSLRMRALYKSKACLHCRTESAYVIFTDNRDKNYEDYQTSDFVQVDENLGIKYTSPEVVEDTILLLRYNCPDDRCDVACFGWSDLRRHVRQKHQKTMCDLCTLHKKVFTHEHTLFTQSQLRKHEKHGDHVPGALEQSGFTGHPECGFCHDRYYSNDELFTHCRDKHERCHICDRQHGSNRPQYYANYDELERHFSEDHYLCQDPECLEKKFVVFENQMDFKAHQLEAHSSSLSKDVRRDARVVDLSSFDNIRAPYQTEGRRRHGQAATEMSSSQAARAEQNRARAIHSAQSVSRRTFGGQLSSTSNNTPGATTPNANRGRPQATTREVTSAVQQLSLDTASTNGTPSPQERARQIAHSGVMGRASAILHNDPVKCNEFRARVSDYRRSSITATNFIDALFSLFDTSSAELGKLIKELAELYEDTAKRNGLLSAWNDWRAINEDYPSLPAPSGNLNSASTSHGTGSGGLKVLRLKSSTTQSGRSVAQRTSAFPTLASAYGQSNNAGGPSTNGAASSKKNSRNASPNPWGAPAASSLSSSSSTVPSTSNHGPLFASASASSQSASRSSYRKPVNPPPSESAFPSLPAAPKPNILMAGLTRNTVRWDRPKAGQGQSAWSGQSVNDDDDNAYADDDYTENAGKKGKGKKKQLLYHFG